MSHQELEKGLTYDQHENYQSNINLIHKIPFSFVKIKIFYLRKKRIFTLLFSILIGQILALLTACTGICSSFIAKNNTSIPIGQNLPHSGLLAFTFGQFIIYRKCKSQCSENVQTLYSAELRKNWWKYLLAAIFDVHANWCLVAAYRYTNIVSIQVLDCMAIGSAMILSRIFFKIRYTLIHYLAVIGCLIGTVIMILSDILYTHTGSEFRFNKYILLGDFLVLLGAFMYGANNVIQQHLTQKNGINNFIGLTSIISTILYSIYTGSIEHSRIDHFFQNFNSVPSEVKWSFLGYTLSMFFLYIAMSLSLKYTNAVFVNLSLLTVDIYNLMIGVYVFNLTFISWYFLALAIIIICVLIFIINEPKSIET